MKNFRTTIYQLLHDEAFRQAMERDMDSALAQNGIVLSAVEKITVQRMLRSPLPEALHSAALSSIPGLPEVDWYFPFSSPAPESL